ncbi:hypothetical protein [Desulfonatronum sp. SC1]|uniref:hypothetical protein n=1 Tax=Desulfonatronum sp. SC1 TaxID=2109626 RepID=UPI0011B1D275|nr:hypothetical protein [Desulfonatronum sp. SC1]
MILKGLLAWLFVLVLAGNAVAAVVTGRINQEQGQTPLPGVNMLLLSALTNAGCHAGCHAGPGSFLQAQLVAPASDNTRVNEIWLATLDVGALNSGDERPNAFPMSKTVIPVGGGNSFQFNTNNISDYDVMILANTEATDPWEVVVGLIALPDGNNSLVNIPLDDLAGNLDLGLVTPGNRLGVATRSVMQAATQFGTFSGQDLSQMAMINDTTKAVINAHVNHDPARGRVVGTGINTILWFSNLNPNTFTSVPADDTSGYNLHFRTNKGTGSPKYLYPPQDVSFNGNDYGPGNPIPMGISHDGGPYYTYFAYGFDRNAPPPPGVWVVKDGTNNVEGQADFSLLGGMDENNNPIVMPSIRPNVDSNGVVTSFDTEWYTMHNGTPRKITSTRALNGVIQQYWFQSSVKQPGQENYSFQGNIIGKTLVPWEIKFQDIKNGYVKVNVVLYGSQFECYFK